MVFGQFKRFSIEIVNGYQKMVSTEITEQNGNVTNQYWLQYFTTNYKTYMMKKIIYYILYQRIY